MDTNSIGSDGTDELLTSLDPLLDQSTQLVLESSRDDKSFVSTFRSSSRQETVLTNDSKSSDGRSSKPSHPPQQHQLTTHVSPRFDPRHASVAEILERTDRQLKALSAARKSNFSSNPPEARGRDQSPQGRTSAPFSSALSLRSDNGGAHRWSENWPQSSPPEEIVISRPVFTRSNGLKEAMDWNVGRLEEHRLYASEPTKRAYPDAVLEEKLRHRLLEAEQKAAVCDEELVQLREKCARKDALLQQFDKNFADVVLKSKSRESEKDETIMALREQLRSAESQVSLGRGDLARLQAVVGEAEQRLKQKDEATAALMAESKDAMRRSADEVKRLRDELEIESSRKSDLLRRNQAMHEEHTKMAMSLNTLEKALEDNRLDSSSMEKDLQAKIDKQAAELNHLNDVIRKQDTVIGDLQHALRRAQAELERWRAREEDWVEEKKAMLAQADSKQAELEIHMKRWEKEVRAKHDKELSEARAAADVAKSQAEQRLRESHRDEIHALTARHQKELLQIRERADAEIARRLDAAEETARDLRSELAQARERGEYYRLKSCESEAQRLRALGQMQALMQASCNQALTVLSKSAAADVPPPVRAEPRPVLEPVAELPALEPGDGFDIIDSLVPRGLTPENGLLAPGSRQSSRPSSSVDLINLGSSRMLEKPASPPVDAL